MPHILHVNAAFLKKRFLKGQNDRHFIHPFRDLLNPASPPCPYLGTDIVKNRNIQFFGDSVGAVKFKNRLQDIGSLYMNAKLSEDLC